MSATVSKPSARTKSRTKSTTATPGRSPSSPPTTKPPTTKLAVPTEIPSAGNTLTLAAIIREHANPALSHDEVTQAVLKALRLPKDTGELLYPALRLYVVNLSRNTVHAIEGEIRSVIGRSFARRGATLERTFSPGDGTLPATLPTVAPLTIDELRHFCREDLVLSVPGESAPIRYADVTRSQWQTKIAAMRLKVTGDLQTIALFEGILSTLEAADADSISEATGVGNGRR